MSSPQGASSRLAMNDYTGDSSYDEIGDGELPISHGSVSPEEDSHSSTTDDGDGATDDESDEDSLDVEGKELAELVSASMDRLNIGTPRLDETTMSIVVQFWEGDAEDMTLTAETDEIIFPRESVQEFCTQPKLRPMMIRQVIKERPVVSDGESDGEGASASECEGEGMRDTGDAEQDIYDEPLPNYIESTGRISVLISMYNQTSSVIGVMTENYNVNNRGADRKRAPPSVLERMRGTGKRVSWLDNSTSRSDGYDSDGDAELNTVTEDYYDSLCNFASETSTEWTNTYARHNVIVSFTRDISTGVLQEVRMGLFLNSPRLRDELQGVLSQSLDNI